MKMIDYNTLIKKKKEVDDNLKKILCNPLKNKPDIFQAIEISKKYDVALHPEFLLYLNELDVSRLILFLDFFKDNFILKNKNLYLPINDFKRDLELLAIEHKIEKQDDKKDELILIKEKYKEILLLNLGIDISQEFQENDILKQIDKIISLAQKKIDKTPVVIINEVHFLEIRDKGGMYIGARMGRPEKAKMRKQFSDETKAVSLFPVSNLDRRNNNIVSVLNNNEFIEEEFRIFYCEKCKLETIFSFCPKCKSSQVKQLCFERYTDKIYDIKKIENVLLGIKKVCEMLSRDISVDDSILEKTKKELELLDKVSVKSNFVNVDSIERIKDLCLIVLDIYLNLEIDYKLDSVNYLIDDIDKFSKSVFYKKYKLDTQIVIDYLKEILGSDYDDIKIVKGIPKLINKHKSVENVVKGYLRAKNEVFVNKDGTIRYDMLEMGLTHFKPKEIGTSIKKLKELGYKQDYLGNDLKDIEQLVEIMPQDVILPDCQESGDELASDFILKTSKYIDDLLVKLYKLEPYYNFKNKEDTVGALVIGLAPHTSAGIVGRVIGYSKTQGCFSHPFWHAAQRRNLDGDENGIILLLDGLINFSRDFLPDRRGTRTMDVSLVLTSHLHLDQIDDEVYGLDIENFYSKEFYDACQNLKLPSEVNVSNVAKKLNVEDLDEKYSGYNFSHNIDNFNDTIVCSAYKSIPTMQEKLDLQLELARKIRAVDEDFVASLVVEKHFLKDIQGNLNKFSSQTFRCTNCNYKYRRPPLTGKCVNCGNFNINFTIHEGSIRKYLNPSLDIIKKYNVDPQVTEKIEFAKLRVEGVFGKEEKDKKLDEF